MTRKEYINSIDVELLLFGLSKRNPYYFRIRMHNDMISFIDEIIEALDKAYENDVELILEDPKISTMDLNMERSSILQSFKLKGEIDSPSAVDIFNICDMQRIKLSENDMQKIVDAIDEMDDDELGNRIVKLRGLVDLIG
jgi:hypothetical protein